MKGHARLSCSVAVAAMGLALGAPAQALSHTWEEAPRFTDVAPANLTWQYRAPSAETGQKSAHELSARRNSNDSSPGRAKAARKSTFTAVPAASVRVTFFGKASEDENDPVARLKVWVHCVREGGGEWLMVGRKDVATNTTGETLRRKISTDACPSQRVDGVVLQVLLGEEGDIDRRTVFLQSAELWQGGAATWTEDFTTP